jgi:vacuolar-type H+-ATPase subunit I/STV1
MIQIYFLSVLFNGLTGYILLLEDREETGTIETSLRLSLNNGVFRLILGILTSVTGVLKLLSPSLDNIPILGDLLPSLTGIIAGFILIFGYYREHGSEPEEEREGKLEKIGNSLLKYKKGFGIVLLGAALFHFLFPQALFL